jgi:rubrerythrin
MPITFNADEVFEMAEQIERNGAEFYREAAEKAGNEEIEQMLLGMAAMEDEHLRTFQEMRTQLSGKEKEETIYDPENEAALYLQTMADGRGFEGKIDQKTKLTGRESIEEILQIAINAEKVSILFYTGLREMVSAKAGRDKVQDIIREEVRHAAILKQQLANMEIA